MRLVLLLILVEFVCVLAAPIEVVVVKVKRKTIVTVNPCEPGYSPLPTSITATKTESESSYVSTSSEIEIHSSNNTAGYFSKTKALPIKQVVPTGKTVSVLPSLAEEAIHTTETYNLSDTVTSSRMLNADDMTVFSELNSEATSTSNSSTSSSIFISSTKATTTLIVTPSLDFVSSAIVLSTSAAPSSSEPDDTTVSSSVEGKSSKTLTTSLFPSPTTHKNTSSKFSTSTSKLITSASKMISSPITSKVRTSTPKPTSSSTSTSAPTSTTLSSSDLQTGIWRRFFREDKSSFNYKDLDCTSNFNSPTVWPMAVLSRGLIPVVAKNKVSTILNNLYKYENKNLGVFSASTNGDDDIYNDDNAQVAWSYISGYEVTNNQQYLNTASAIVEFLMKQTNTDGGVFWKYKQPYIASISTIEASLAAIRLYKHTREAKLLDYSKKTLSFMFEKFQDPGDKLFYDGFTSPNLSSMNKGKLTYTVGCCMSALAHLYNFDSVNKVQWTNKMQQLSKAVLNRKGAFYEGTGLWNNQLKYIHLLYTGIADIGQLVNEDFSDLQQEAVRQARYIKDYLLDIDNLYFENIRSCPSNVVAKYTSVFGASVNQKTVNYCSGIAEKDLMVNASVLQILQSVGI